MRTLLTPVLGLMLVATSADACDTRGEPWLELRVTASEYAGADRTLRVALHDNGCADIRRPAYYVSPGDFRLMLDDSTRERFAQLARSPALASFDAQLIRAGVSQRLADADGEAEALFEVADAGRFELTLRDAGGRKDLQFDGVPQYAERFPDLAGLADFNAVVDAAHALADDPRRRPATVAGGGGAQ